MALSGAYVAYADVVNRTGASLPGDIAWSEPLVSGTLITNSRAPADGMFIVHSAFDVWVTFGLTPADPSQSTSPRVCVAGGVKETFFVQKGYRAAIVAA